MPGLTLDDARMIREEIINPIVSAVEAKMETQLVAGKSVMDELERKASNSMSAEAAIRDECETCRNELSKRVGKLESGYKYVASVCGLIGAAFGAVGWQLKSWACSQLSHLLRN